MGAGAGHVLGEPLVEAAGVADQQGLEGGAEHELPADEDAWGVVVRDAVEPVVPASRLEQQTHGPLPRALRLAPATVPDRRPPGHRPQRARLGVSDSSSERTTRPGVSRSVPAMAPYTNESRFRGEPAITLESGELSATFLPEVGMTGVSLRLRGRQYLALPGGVDHLRAGGTGGLPLLAPWANRLAVAPLPHRCHDRRSHGSAARHRRQRTADPRPARRRRRAGASTGTTSAARTPASEHRSTSTRPAFPFPHRIEVVVTARDSELDIADHRRPDRQTARADRLRLASVSAAAGRTAPAAGGCGCRSGDTSSSIRFGHPDRRGDR